MARIRTIKPEFFTSLPVASLPLTARLTFIGLWTHCDDQGRCVDEARLIKAALWPLDDRTAADVEEDLKAIDQAALIVRYTVGGRRYLAVRGWAEHQRVNRPSPSKIPPPPNPPPGTHGGLSEDSVSPQTLPADPAHEPSHGGEMSDSHDRLALQPSNAVTSTDEPSTPPLTSQNELTENSVSPHGTLTEDSPQERKGTGNREQGRERAHAGAQDTSPEPPPDPAAPPPSPEELPWHPLDDFKLTDAMRRHAARTYPGLNADFEWAQFVSHHRAVGTQRRSWPDAFNKWLGDSAKRASERALASHARTPNGSGSQLPARGSYTNADPFKKRKTA